VINIDEVLIVSNWHTGAITEFVHVGYRSLVSVNLGESILKTWNCAERKIRRFSKRMQRLTFEMGIDPSPAIAG